MSRSRGRQRQVNRHSATPLYRQVADLLTESIRSGELKPGDRLPRESDMAEEFGVNRLTVRQALSDLVSAGLVRTVQGSGSFVADRPIRHDISGDREASLTRAMAASGRVVRQQLLRTTRDDDPATQRSLGTRAHLRRFDLLRFVDDSPWTISRMWVSERRFRTLEDHWNGSTSFYDTLERHYGIQMRRAHRTIWSEPAGPVDCEHLMVPIGSPVLVMGGLNVTPDAEPVAVVEHRGRGDRVQFTVHFDDA